MSQGKQFFQHPEYDALAPKWQRYRDLYIGDHAVLTAPQYLWPHELESSANELDRDPNTGAVVTVGQKLRSVRAMRSRNLNMLEPIVSNWVSILFRKEIQIDEATRTMLGDEIHNIDGRGSSLNAFIENEVAVAYFRDGRPVVYADAPEANFRNRAEEQASGFQPFLSVLDVLTLKDWELHESGALTGKYRWARWEYKLIEPRESPEQKPREVTHCVVAKHLSPAEPPTLEFYKQDGESKLWELVDERPLVGLEELPLATIHTNEPWVHDLSELQLVLFNLLSAYYCQLNQQAFQRIFIAGNLGEKHLISISEYAISQLPDGASVNVIEPSDMSSVKQAIEDTIDRMYRVGFNRTRGLSGTSNEAPGADTLREMNHELVSLLLIAAEEIENVVNEGLRHYARFKGITDFQGKIELDKSITAEDVAQEMETFAVYRDELRKNLPWRKAHLKKVASRMGYGEEELKEIVAEIDKLKELDPMQELGMLGVNRPIQPLVEGNGGQQQQQQQSQSGQADPAAAREQNPK